MISPKPAHIPFYLRPDVENIISALSMLRHELEDGDVTGQFLAVDRRRLLARVKSDLRFYLTISQRRGL